MKPVNTSPITKLYCDFANSLPENSILLIRLGSFWKAFFAHAEILSDVCRLGITKKDGNPLSGFPSHLKEAKTKKLNKKGFTVYFLEKKGGGISYELIEVKKPAKSFEEEVVGFLEDLDPTIEHQGTINIQCEGYDFNFGDLNGFWTGDYSRLFLKRKRWIGDSERLDPLPVRKSLDIKAEANATPPQVATMIRRYIQCVCPKMQTIHVAFEFEAEEDHCFVGYWNGKQSRNGYSDISFGKETYKRVIDELESGHEGELADDIKKHFDSSLGMYHVSGLCSWINYRASMEWYGWEKLSIAFPVDNSPEIEAWINNGTTILLGDEVDRFRNWDFEFGKLPKLLGSNWNARIKASDLMFFDLEFPVSADIDVLPISYDLTEFGKNHDKTNCDIAKSQSQSDMSVEDIHKPVKFSIGESGYPVFRGWNITRIKKMDGKVISMESQGVFVDDDVCRKLRQFSENDGTVVEFSNPSIVKNAKVLGVWDQNEKLISCDELYRSMIDEIESREDLKGCVSFSQLHDHCDANMLGLTEKYLDQVGHQMFAEYIDPCQNRVDEYLKLKGIERVIGEVVDGYGMLAIEELEDISSNSSTLENFMSKTSEATRIRIESHCRSFMSRMLPYQLERSLNDPLCCGRVFYLLGSGIVNLMNEGKASNDSRIDDIVSLTKHDDWDVLKGIAEDYPHVELVDGKLKFPAFI